MAKTKRGIDYEVVETTQQGVALWSLPFLTVIPWQAAPVPEVGRTGFQPEELLEVTAERLRQLNAEVPARETSLAITNIEQAILWLEERRRDRLARGVEGTRAA